ncbi:MAG: polysaccharide deacetylase family protein [Thermoleophilaceae bacterium]
MNDLLVLCYHGISRSWPADTSVTPEDFERQLSDLLARGYRGATFSDALTAPKFEKTLVVTFDDAHRSVLDLAAPLMARLGVPGTVYVPTDYATSQRPMGWDGYDIWVGTQHEHELACMTWDELGGLVGDGWEVGSHTRSHPRLSILDDAEIAAELTDSRVECEDRTGRRCTSIAYPYSDYDDRVVRAARDCGYVFAATVPRGPRPPLPLQWPRVGAYNGESSRRIRLRARIRRFSPSSLATAAAMFRGARR